MLWKGRVLVYKEDFAEAMAACTKEDAEEFSLLFKNAFQHAEAVMGYLIGDIHPVERNRVESLFNVTHPLPVHDKSIVELFHTGIELAPKPEWLSVVLQIPRRDCKPSFDSQKGTNG